MAALAANLTTVAAEVVTTAFVTMDTNTVYGVTVDNNGSFDDNITNMTTTTVAPVVENAATIVRDLILNHLGPAVCVFGMVCNVMNLMVLTQNQLPESPYTHLTGLACTDFSALMLSFIYMVFSKDSYTYAWKSFEAYVFIGLVNIFVTSSVWITVQLTIERFLFVRYPLWAKDTCDQTSAKMKVLITVLVASIFNIPRFLCFKPTLHKGIYVLGSTEFRRTNIFLVINWVYSFSTHFIPLAVLLCANFYLVYAVHRAGNQREKLQIRNNREAAWQREQRRLTITLISIVFLFIVCIIPGAFADRPIAYAMFGGGKTEAEFVSSPFYFILQYLANFLVWCNLSLNFVLYCAFNEKFRRVMRFTFKRWTKGFLCRKGEAVLLHVNFKPGHSFTRNSTLPTNSISMNSKPSLTQQESQPLQKYMEKMDTKTGNVENGTLLLTNHKEP